MNENTYKQPMKENKYEPLIGDIFRFTVTKSAKPKSLMKIGCIEIYIDRKFNWFQKLMYRVSFGIIIEDMSLK